MAQIVITWGKETGQLNVASQDVNTVEILGVLDMAASSIRDKARVGPGHPTTPGGSPGSATRSPALIVNKVS